MIYKPFQFFLKKGISYKIIKKGFPFLVMLFTDIFFKGNTIQKMEAKEILVTLLSISTFSQRIDENRIPEDPVNAIKTMNIANEILLSFYPEFIKKAKQKEEKELNFSFDPTFNTTKKVDIN